MCVSDGSFTLRVAVPSETKTTYSTYAWVCVCECVSRLMYGTSGVCAAHYAGQGWMLQSSSWFIGLRAGSQKSAGTVVWDSFSTHSQRTRRLPGKCTRIHTKTNRHTDTHKHRCTLKHENVCLCTKIWLYPQPWSKSLFRDMKKLDISMESLCFA